MQSAYSGTQTAKTGDDDREAQLELYKAEKDMLFTVGKERTFGTVKPTLHKLGIENYDQVQKMDNLKFTMAQAHRTYCKTLLTENKERIRSVVRLGIVRDVRSINERQEARKYAQGRPRTYDLSKSEGRNSSMN